MIDQAAKLRLMSKDNYTMQTKPKRISSTPAAVIAVTSGKGGVGKTNFAVNLALALANLGQKILVIDADLGMANIDVVMGHSTEYNIMHLLSDQYRISDILVSGPRNIKFMAGGSGIHELANLSDQQMQKIIQAIVQFDQDVDYILIDTGAGLSRNVLNFVLAADEVIIITTPEPTAITDAYAMMKAFVASKGTSPLQLVVNRVVDTNEGSLVADKLIKVAQRFLRLEIGYLGSILEDANMLKAIRQQHPLMLSYPDTVSARSIEEIAARLVYGEVQVQSTGLKGFFRKYFNIMS